MPMFYIIQGPHPYRDFPRKTQSLSVQGQRPYRDIFWKTQSPHYRAHTRGETFKNSKSPVQSPHTGKRLKTQSPQCRAHTQGGTFENSESLVQSPHTWKTFENSKSPVQTFFTQYMSFFWFLYEHILRNMRFFFKYYCESKLIVLIVWVRKNLL